MQLIFTKLETSHLSVETISAEVKEVFCGRPSHKFLWPSDHMFVAYHKHTPTACGLHTNTIAPVSNCDNPSSFELPNSTINHTQCSINISAQDTWLGLSLILQIIRPGKSFLTIEEMLPWQIISIIGHRAILLNRRQMLHLRRTISSWFLVLSTQREEINSILIVLFQTLEICDHYKSAHVEMCDNFFYLKSISILL